MEKHSKPLLTRAQRPNLAFALIVVPGLLIITCFITFVVVNLFFNPTFWMRPDGYAVIETPLVVTVINWTLFIIGAMGAVCLIPGIIIGIMMLVRHKSLKK